MTIPATLGGCPVTAIRRYAFDGCDALTSVTIPFGVTSIGEYAFPGCMGLATVAIPSSVTSIEGDAFWGCNSLATVHVEQGDADRFRYLLGGSGYSTDSLEFVEDLTTKYTVTFYGGGKTLGTATVETGKNTNQAAASAYKPTREGYVLTGWYDANDNIIFDAQGRAANGMYWNGSYVKGTSSATWVYDGNVTAYAHWELAERSSASKAVYVATPNDDDELFAPGEFVGVFADGEGSFALTLDEGLETAYLVTWTADGGVTCECEAVVADDTLVLTTEAGEVYRLVWDGGSLIATRVE